MKRILILVLAALMLSALTPALAESTTISYDGITIDFTMPTTSPLFGSLNGGDTYFMIMAPMDYGSGQTTIRIAQGTPEGWVNDKIANFQNYVETDQNSTHTDPQVSGPTVWTLDNGLQAQVAYATEHFESMMSKAMPGHPGMASYEYYVAIPLYSDYILTGEFSQKDRVDKERLLTDDVVLSVLNNLVITVPEAQEAAPAEAQPVEQQADVSQGAPNAQDDLIAADMRDGLVLEDCRFVMVPSSDTYWNIYLYLAIRNDSNETIMLDGAWQMLDANGNVLKEDEYPSCYPSELAPGEVGYMSEWEFISTDEIPSRETISRVNVSFGANEYPTNYTYTPLDITSETLQDVGSSKFVLRCTITNNGSEMVSTPWIVVSLYDQNNKLACVQSSCISTASSFYLPAGQQVVVDFALNNDLVDYYVENGIELDTVKLLAYTYR